MKRYFYMTVMALCMATIVETVYAGIIGTASPLGSCVQVAGLLAVGVISLLMVRPIHSRKSRVNESEVLSIWAEAEAEGVDDDLVVEMLESSKQIKPMCKCSANLVELDVEELRRISHTVVEPEVLKAK